MEKHEAIMEAFIALYDGQLEECRELLRRSYPFDPRTKPRQVPAREDQVSGGVRPQSAWDADPGLKMQVFKRDGFVNRFTGEPLVLTAALRLLSHEAPEEFPHQTNWKLGQTHIAYYDLGTCANKLLPPTRGGVEDESNLVTTTMPYVMARGNATVEEAGLEIVPVGDAEEWDGLSRMFVDVVRQRPELKKLSFVRSWYPAVARSFR